MVVSVWGKDDTFFSYYYEVKQVLGKCGELPSFQRDGYERWNDPYLDIDTVRNSETGREQVAGTGRPSTLYLSNLRGPLGVLGFGSFYEPNRTFA